MSKMYAQTFNSKSADGFRLKGKVAIVTASTSGLGYAIAKRLGEEGAAVVVSSRKKENVNRATESLRREGVNVVGVVCHVANEKQRKDLFATAKNTFGGLDILVSNAAVNPATASILESDEKVWNKIFDINLKCCWLLAKEARSEFIKRGGGNIVFISSIAAYNSIYKTNPPLGVYSVSKTALFGLMKAMAGEIVHENIRVNCVAPGPVSTKFAAVITSSEEAKEKRLSVMPMKRFGQPSEIASVVAFLVSDDASYVTGETVVAAGGVYAHL